MTQVKQQNWFALEILVETEASEAVEFGLNELESLGTEINNLGKVPGATVKVVGYFNNRSNDLEIIEHLNNALQIYGFEESVIKSTVWVDVEDQDWLAEWKRHWKPTETDKFIIAPVWETIERTDKIVIRIEPSMAFGTGTHETTRLCLRAIEQHYSGESFFDVGTGTGILAIAAAKLKVKGSDSRFEGVDVDEDSIIIAKENAAVNDTPQIVFNVGSLDEDTPNSGFVCANLTADVIVPILPLLVRKFDERLVLSGILKEQEEWVVNELKKLNVKNFSIQTDGEWISIVVHH